MYEFTPAPKRTGEKLWMSVCLLLGAASYGFGQILPYPVVYQLLAVILFTVSVTISVRYLLRDYVYRVEADDRGISTDLIVTEVMGRRRTVVCRISVDQIGQILSATEVAAQKSHRSIKKKGLYRYVSQMGSNGSAFLEILDDEKVYFLEIYADQALISLLKAQKKQYLSDE